MTGALEQGSSAISVITMETRVGGVASYTRLTRFTLWWSASSESGEAAPVLVFNMSFGSAEGGG